MKLKYYIEDEYKFKISYEYVLCIGNYSNVIPLNNLGLNYLLIFTK